MKVVVVNPFAWNLPRLQEQRQRSWQREEEDPDEQEALCTLAPAQAEIRR